MATAYVSFCRALAADTCSQLIAACKTLVAEVISGTNQITGEKTDMQKWDTIDLSITCGGGDLLSSFACYNELLGLPVTFVTRNCGAVDSAAIMLFLLGTRRYASRASAFFFHQTAWTFPSQANVPIGTIADAAEYLGHYQKMMSELVASKSRLTADDIQRLMTEGSTMLPTEAKERGLIDEVDEISLPFGARWWQV